MHCGKNGNPPDLQENSAISKSTPPPKRVENGNSKKYTDKNNSCSSSSSSNTRARAVACEGLQNQINYASSEAGSLLDLKALGVPVVLLCAGGSSGTSGGSGVTNSTTLSPLGDGASNGSASWDSSSR